jgi:hypothetical protein
VYIVSDEPSQVPELRFVYSKGLFIKNGAVNEAARLPTDEDIKIISTKEAKKLFGTGAQIIDGVTVSCPPRFSFNAYVSTPSSLSMTRLNCTFCGFSIPSLWH